MIKGLDDAWCYIVSIRAGFMTAFTDSSQIPVGFSSWFGVLLNKHLLDIISQVAKILLKSQDR